MARVNLIDEVEEITTDQKEWRLIEQFLKVLGVELSNYTTDVAIEKKAGCPMLISVTQLVLPLDVNAHVETDFRLTPLDSDEQQQ